MCCFVFTSHRSNLQAASPFVSSFAASPEHAAAAPAHIVPQVVEADAGLKERVALAARPFGHSGGVQAAAEGTRHLVRCAAAGCPILAVAAHSMVVVRVLGVGLVRWHPAKPRTLLSHAPCQPLPAGGRETS